MLKIKTNLLYLCTSLYTMHNGGSPRSGSTFYVPLNCHGSKLSVQYYYRGGCRNFERGGGVLAIAKSQAVPSGHRSFTLIKSKFGKSWWSTRPPATASTPSPRPPTPTPTPNSAPIQCIHLKSCRKWCQK